MSDNNTAEPILQCPHEGCTAGFRRKSRLEQHIRVHTGEV